MGVTSRAPSAGLRGPNVARTIAKRRDKPYKTEHSLIFAKKKKLNIHTTYTKAPAGFTYLPVGTPQLADRCKELSRQRGLPINVVNAKPHNRDACDPAKISHHIQRIGYHFRSEVVEDACQQLGYIPTGRGFLRPEELQAENERSRMARTLARHGMRLDETTKPESDEQVRSSIKELFPRIPEADLKEILRHAWAEGTDRVGTNNLMQLPRRVQLAVIARIRHVYTDYDRLLRAFEWKEARALVEPTCLAKLIEWRGENDLEDDNEFEEVVRETIVIDDDDDDAPRNGHGSDDEDSAEPGYHSDTSMEISHRPAEEADLGAESHDEKSGRLLSRFPPPGHRRYMDIGQKLGAVREQLRNGTFAPQAPPSAPANVIKVHIPENKDTVQIGGQTFRRATPATPIQFQPVPTGGAYGFQPENPRQAPVTQSYSRPANHADNRALHDRPIASIEPQDDLRRMALVSRNGHQSRPVTPDEDRARKRRRSDYGSVVNGSTAGVPIVISSDSSGPTPRRANNVVDLTADSPPRMYSRGPASTMDPMYGHFGRPILQPVLNGRNGVGHAPVSVEAVGYNPQPAMIPSKQRAEHPRNWAPPRGLVDSQVAPVQYMPLQPPSSTNLGPPSLVHGMPSHPPAFGTQQPKLYYVSRPRSSYTPQPVHGAPAAVQQVSRPYYGTPGQSPTALTQPATQPPPSAGFGQQQLYYCPR